MLFTLQDIAGLLLAVLLAVAVLVLPGYAIGRLTGALGFRAADPARRVVLALLLAYAVLPIADSMIARVAGLWAALAVNLALAAFAILGADRASVPKLSRTAWSMLAAALAVLVVAWVDFAWAGRLYPSLLMIDMVKHAATVRAIVEAGATPPTDPFFLRDGLASYYYFYYTASAMIEVLAGGLIDSRAAVGGQVFWTAIALVGLAGVVFEAAGWRRAASATGASRDVLPWGLIVVLMTSAGLQIVLALIGFLLVGHWPAQSGWFNEQVTSWMVVSLLWVPHHVAALIAAWVGFLALIAGGQSHAQSGRMAGAVLAGFAFASAVGLSTWVTLGAMATVALWGLLLAVERRWSAFGVTVMAGAVALVVASPHLSDLAQFRSFGQAPIALQVRSFIFADMLGDLFGATSAFRLGLMPLNYACEFGLFGLGAVLFWRRTALARAHATDTARMLTLSAVAGLAISACVASVVVNNDLGWRVILFAQLATLLWTAQVLGPLWLRLTTRQGTRRRLGLVPRAVAVLLAIGSLGGAHDLIGLRAFHGLGLRQGHGEVRDPAVDYDVRRAYAWLAANVDHAAVAQHDPGRIRAYGYGLYGRQRTAVADTHNPRLFGASMPAVADRLAALEPLFAGPFAAAQVRRVLQANHADLVVVAGDDKVWQRRISWIFATPPLYANDRVRILRVRDLVD